MRKKFRFLTVLAVCVMVLSCFSVTAFAYADDTEQNLPVTEATQPEQQPVSDIRLSTRHGNHAIETEVEDAAFDFRHGTPGADEELVAVGLGLFASDFGRFGYDVVFVG